MADKPFNTINYQTMALAAALSGLEQVRLLAKQGHCDSNIKRQLYDSILIVDADHPDSIYPNKEMLRGGCKQWTKIVEQGFDNESQQLLSYLVAANRLAKQLLSNHTLQTELAQRITEQSQREKNKLSPAEVDNDLAGESNILDIDSGPNETELAAIYEQTLSKLPYRINIHGLQTHLAQEPVRVQVRALLLAIVRALVLWRQLGGNALQLFLHRNAYAKVCKQALTTH